MGIGKLILDIVILPIKIIKAPFRFFRKKKKNIPETDSKPLPPVFDTDKLNNMDSRLLEVEKEIKKQKVIKMDKRLTVDDYQDLMSILDKMHDNIWRSIENRVKDKNPEGITEMIQDQNHIKRLIIKLDAKIEQGDNEGKSDSGNDSPEI